MDIRIGIQNSGRELNFETADDADTVRKAISTALDSGSPQVSFTDNKGNIYIVPTASLAYIELGTEEARRVGFVA